MSQNLLAEKQKQVSVCAIWGSTGTAPVSCWEGLLTAFVVSIRSDQGFGHSES